MNHISDKIKGTVFLLWVFSAMLASCERQIDPGNWDIHWPIIDFSFAPVTPLIGDSVDFEALTKNGSSRIVKWEWTVSDSSATITTGTGAEPSFVFDKEGTYQVGLLATDSTGNTDYVSKNVTVLADTGVLVRVMVCCAKPKTYNEETFQQLADIINEFKPDLVLMRQVDSGTTRALGMNVPAFVGEKTGMDAYFGKAFDYKGGGYGNALLSRLPVVDSATLSLPPDPSLGGEVRSAPMITVQLPNKRNSKLVFVGTELDAGKTDQSRVYQLNAVFSSLNGDTLPVILGGDFNDVAGSQTFSLLESRFTMGCLSNGCPLNNPVSNPSKTYDYVFYHPSGDFVLAKTTTATESISSNYLPIIVDIRYKPGK